MNVEKIIKDLGGTSAVAEMCNIKPPSVSGWIKANEIPDARLQYLRLLHPNVFAANSVMSLAA